jgi:hypothetical protein
VTDDFQFNEAFTGFPFERVLSLEPLIERWRCIAAGGVGERSGFARRMLEKVDSLPVLHGPIEDLAVLEAHRGLLDDLMSSIFSEAFWEKYFTAATMPFRFQCFYATPSFRQLLMGEDNAFRGVANLPDDTLSGGRYSVPISLS